MEEFSKMMLHINEIKFELGRLVQELTNKARKGIESDEEVHQS